MNTVTFPPFLAQLRALNTPPQPSDPPPPQPSDADLVALWDAHGLQHAKDALLGAIARGELGSFDSLQGLVATFRKWAKSPPADGWRFLPQLGDAEIAPARPYGRIPKPSWVGTPPGCDYNLSPWLRPGVSETQETCFRRRACELVEALVAGFTPESFTPERAETVLANIGSEIDNILSRLRWGIGGPVTADEFAHKMRYGVNGGVSAGTAEELMNDIAIDAYEFAKYWANPNAEDDAPEPASKKEPPAVLARPMSAASTRDLECYRKAVNCELGRRGGDAAEGWTPFPLACLPKEIATFVETAALAHSVDPVSVALPVLAVASAAGGAAFQLELKPGWRVFPALWAVLVARTGGNKSGPLDLVVKPLWEQPPIDASSILRTGQQAQWVLTDATTEAVLALLARCQRGLLLSADELAGWLGSFDAYRSGKGGDEQKWIRLWDGKRYVVNRKTNDETTDLRAPLVAICGAIQPELLSKATDADKLAGGFLARVLCAMPPEHKRVWNDEGVQPELEAFWADMVNAIRGRPFAAINTLSGHGEPNIVALSPRAAVAFVDYFNRNASRIMETGGVERILAAKSDVHAARLALVLHLLKCGLGAEKWGSPVSVETMQAAVTLANWFTDEATRVFTCLCGTARDGQREKLKTFIEGEGGKVSVRRLMRSNMKRYPAADSARATLLDLVQAGLGTLTNDTFTMTAGG